MQQRSRGYKQVLQRSTARLVRAALAASTPKCKGFVVMSVAVPILLTSLYFRKAHLCYKCWMEPFFQGTFCKDLLLLQLPSVFDVPACRSGRGIPASAEQHGQSHRELTRWSQLGKSTVGMSRHTIIRCSCCNQEQKTND